MYGCVWCIGTDRGKTQVLGEKKKIVPVPLCHPQIPHRHIPNPDMVGPLRWRGQWKLNTKNNISSNTYTSSLCSLMLCTMVIQFSLCTSWRHTGGEKVQLHSVLPSSLDSGSVISFKPQQLYSLGDVPGTLCIGGWVGPRTSLEVLEKRKSLATCHSWNEIMITSKCWRTTALLVWLILLRPNQWTDSRVQASCMIMVGRFSPECVRKVWCGIQETQILSKYFITSD